MITVNHILAKEGILTTFSIAKRVTTKDIQKMREKMKTAKVSSNKLKEVIRQSVVNETKESLKNNRIPGLIMKDIPAVADKSEEDKKIMELTYFASLIAKKITEKKMDKYYACYIVNALVNMLGLNDNDFETFHKKFAKYKNGESPEEESGTTDA
jgi:hypothetical protein